MQAPGSQPQSDLHPSPNLGVARGLCLGLASHPVMGLGCSAQGGGRGPNHALTLTLSYPNLDHNPSPKWESRPESWSKLNRCGVAIRRAAKRLGLGSG